jgi:sulfite reductase beta subunit-like hemoprotein
MSHLSQKPSELKPLDIPSWDLVLKRNSIERMKQEKFPLDIIYELPQLIAVGYEAIPEEDIVRLQWWGLYHDKPKVGTFMMRIKIAGGYLTPQKLRAIGEIANRYGKGYGEISTRQNIQLHWIRLDDLPAIFEHLQANGLTTAGGCGDTVRNITGCPVADIDRHQLFDVQPLIQEAARFFYGNRDYSNLPRKHKITIAACPFQCNAPEIHCIALVGVIKDGRKGFAVRIGGGLSSTPRISRDMGVFVPYEEALEVLRAIIDCWKENPRYRLSRVKARLKFMVDDYGVEEYRRMVEERLGRKLEDFQAPEAIGETDHLGVHPQKQSGLFYIGVPVPVGWMSGRSDAAGSGHCRGSRWRYPLDAPAKLHRRQCARTQGRLGRPPFGESRLPLAHQPHLGSLYRLHGRTLLQLLRHRDEDETEGNRGAVGGEVWRGYR